MSALEDIPSPMPSTKPHGLKTSSCESIASPTVGPSVASRLFRSRRFQSSQASAAREFDSTFARHLSRGGHVHMLHAQQLRASQQRGGFWLSSIACASPSPSFQAFTLGRPSRVRASLPELFSGVYPNPMKSPNHALQRTAPRVTVAAVSSLVPSRPSVALSYVRCLLLRSTFAATAPRSAVAELGVVRRLSPSPMRPKTKI